MSYEISNYVKDHLKKANDIIDSDSELEWENEKEKSFLESIGVIIDELIELIEVAKK